MLRLVQPDRSYTPETVAVMGAAFDRVCQSISKRMNDSGDVEKTLALIILDSSTGESATLSNS